MSIDILLQCFRDGEPATFKRELVEKIFARDANDYRPPLTGVRYADGGGAEIYGADNGDDIQNLMFNHFGGRTFFNPLYELARETKSVVLMVTESNPIAVTDQETADHLPPGFAGLSTPAIVSSGTELAAHLYGAD
ncbi:MAG TPA: hypothetical protein VJN67_02130 [Stellaceae bacterium]|nr:hypothetical protein [Stellaceae bacterium]